jgi:hypothetical protein
MTRLQLARFIRFGMKPLTCGDMPMAHYVVDSDRDLEWRLYNLRQLRQLSKERLGETIVEGLFKMDPDMFLRSDHSEVLLEWTDAELAFVKQCFYRYTFCSGTRTVPVWSLKLLQDHTTLKEVNAWLVHYTDWENIPFGVSKMDETDKVNHDLSAPW